MAVTCNATRPPTHISLTQKYQYLPPMKCYSKGKTMPITQHDITQVMHLIFLTYRRILVTTSKNNTKCNALSFPHVSETHFRHWSIGQVIKNIYPNTHTHVENILKKGVKEQKAGQCRTPTMGVWWGRDEDGGPHVFCGETRCSYLS